MQLLAVAPECRPCRIVRSVVKMVFERNRIGNAVAHSTCTSARPVVTREACHHQQTHTKP